MRFSGGLPIVARLENLSLIYNPAAGHLRRRPGAIAAVLEALARQGFRVEAMPTSGPGAAEELARRAAGRGADAVLVAGGDGTVNEVVNGLAATNTPLAVLGGGTANVFLSEFGLNRLPEVNALRLSQMIRVRVAAASLRCCEASAGSRKFLLMAGCGLDARVVRCLDPVIKNRFGKFAYYLAGFSQVGARLPQFVVRAADREIVCSFALASRVKNYGGDLEIATQASLFTGEFEVVCFEGAYGASYLPYFFGVLTRRLRKMEGVSFLRADRVSVEPLVPGETVDLQVDGEWVGVAPAEMEIIPSAATLLLPPETVARASSAAPARARVEDPTAQSK